MIRLVKVFGSLVTTIALFVTLLFGGSLISGSHFQALAKPMTPEAAAYEIDNADSPQEAADTIKNKAQDYKQELDRDANYTKTAVKDASEGTKNKLEEIADTVTEKLNLNEPLPESTKEFLNDVQGKTDDVVEPVTQGRPGYFKFERDR